ncbi:MAG: putative DNA ligase [candidate division WS6 bacterium GW2011_GWF2_39_15]|uniref:DNA ligase (ATP) n=1 Tax=candidate division WS6 bacterium GW2011_GWF2_39_15 TaxID=1619100 RepID=A0A0G0Q7K1_9BACT|nr:MAG: putative DNA ligase [candidate division WS6 bacterium GW2011_GWF2_39_15]
MISFLKASEIFQSIESISSRNEMTVILAEAVRVLDEKDIQVFSYLVQGRVAPMFIPAEYNLSEKGLINALSNVYGNEVSVLRKKEGDLGSAVEKLVDHKTKGLSLIGVYEALWTVVNSQGSGSVDIKAQIFLNTVKQMSPLEARYFTRIIVGSLRLGCSTRTLLDAFSMFLVGDKSKRDVMDKAYGSCADIGYIASLVKEDNPLKHLEEVVPIPGIPILSRLVERVKSFDEVKDRFPSTFMVQPKYDGLRCQIHKIGDSQKSLSERIWFGRQTAPSHIDMFGGVQVPKVKLFTRNLEDITDMFPEVVESAINMGGDSFILDSEVVGWNAKEKKFLSYQDTMTRRRKYGIEERQQNIPVNAFAFDVMYLDGKEILNRKTGERFENLEKLFEKGESSIQLSPVYITNEVEELRELFKEYIGMGLEGVIVKDVDGGYSPGARDFEWIKIKKSIDNNLVDTVDLVVLGYYLGSGKRSKFGIGAILGGVYNPDSETYESVTKIGTGITDEQWGTIKGRLDTIVVKEKPKNVAIEGIMKPDVFVSPEVVITVDADEVSVNRKSESVARGLSLRFPRLIEFDRDKNPEDATTIDELLLMKK